MVLQPGPFDVSGSPGHGHCRAHTDQKRSGEKYRKAFCDCRNRDRLGLSGFLAAHILYLWHGDFHAGDKMNKCQWSVASGQLPVVSFSLGDVTRHVIRSATNN